MQNNFQLSRISEERTDERTSSLSHASHRGLPLIVSNLAASVSHLTPVHFSRRASNCLHSYSNSNFESDIKVVASLRHPHPRLSWHRVGLSKYFRCILGVSYALFGFSHSLSLSLCLPVLCCCCFCFALCSVLLAKCSRLAGLVCVDPFHVGFVCLLLLPQFMMRTAFHFRLFIFCGLCRWQLWWEVAASGSKECMVRFLISDSTLGSCYAALS